MIPNVALDGLIHVAVVGSQAHGLATPTSDTDRKGIYVLPTHRFWSLQKPPQHCDDKAVSLSLHEIEHFLKMAATGDPTILEVLWSQTSVMTSHYADRLLAERDIFLTRKLEHRYLGYAADQMKRYERTIRENPEPNWKPAYHMLRLLLAAARVPTERRIMVRVPKEWRQYLLDVRQGKVTYEELVAAYETLESQARFNFANQADWMPERVDIDRVDAILSELRGRFMSDWLTDNVYRTEVGLPA